MIHFVGVVLLKWVVVFGTGWGLSILLSRYQQWARVANRLITKAEIREYENLRACKPALLWVSVRPRTYGELQRMRIGWLAWVGGVTKDRELITWLSRDSKSKVRYAVCSNKNTPIEVLRVLAKDENVSVGWSARAALRRRAESCPSL